MSGFRLKPLRGLVASGFFSGSPELPGEKPRLSCEQRRMKGTQIPHFQPLLPSCHGNSSKGTIAPWTHRTVGYEMGAVFSNGLWGI